MIRAHEKEQLPFLRAAADFDIVIEIGYQEERGQPIGLKQLYSVDICSPSTIRRRLGALLDDGVVLRRPVANDRRAALLIIAPTTMKLLRKFSSSLSAVSDLHFR